MKKIFIIIGSLGIGGTEKQLLIKIDYLKKRYDFTLIFFFKKGELYKSFKNLGINIIDLSSSKKNKILNYIQAYLSVLSLIKRNRPDILNFYLPHSYLIFGSLAYFFKNVNFVMSRRSLNNYQKKIPLVRFVEKRILHRKMKFILANSNAIKDELILEEGVSKEKINLIYNSVKLRKIEKIKKNKNIRILHLANLIPYKNHKLIIKACNVLKHVSDFRVELIGDGEINYKEELKNEIKKYNLSDKIYFHGKIKDFESIIRTCDIGVLTSSEEGFSNSILEYMSYGLPVIATNVGGNSEIIDHNRNGYLVEEDDFMSFAKYLETLINNKKLRTSLGRNGYTKVKKNFSIKKNMENYYNFYQSL